jgi:hypothetical protein
MGFLKRANGRRYKGLWCELENNFTHGQDHYPADLTNAYNLLLNYKTAPMPRSLCRDRPRQAKEETGMSFLQTGRLVPNKNGETHTGVKCFNCNKHGQYASACRRDDAEPNKGIQIIQVATTHGHNVQCLQTVTNEPYESELRRLQPHSVILDST